MSNWALHCCGAASAAAFALLAWLSRTSDPINVWTLIASMGVAWTAVIAAFFIARRSRAHKLIQCLWFWAVVLRIIAWIGEPILEDDYFRYLWDGRQFALTGNPYGTPPASHFADSSVEDRFQTILSNINNPHLPTIYGPVCEYIFLAAHQIAPGRLWPIKLFLIAADLVTLWLLLGLITPRNALLYAWCPLLIQETAFTAHPEILGIVFIVAALRAARSRSVTTAAILCGCAVAARIHAVLIVPFVLLATVRPAAGRGGGLLSAIRTFINPTFVVFFALSVGVLYVPFWVRGSAADLTALRAFVEEWEFNSSLVGLLQFLVSFNTAKVLCSIVFGVLYTYLLIRWFTATAHNPPPPLPGDVLYGLFLLSSAVVNPWYALWLAPFVAMRPSITGIVALGAVTLSYLHGANLGWPGLGAYDHPKWVRPLEYGLVLAAAMLQWRRNLLAAKRNAH